MSFFNKIIKAGAMTLTLPVDIVKDVAAAVKGANGGNTAAKIEKVGETVDEAIDDIDPPAPTGCA